MTSPRDTAIAAATALIDALIAATKPALPPVIVPPPIVMPPPVTPPVVIAPVVAPTTGHPRIMLGSQAPRLKAALSSPAGVRWRRACDSWLAGGDLWGFDAWNGALLSQLTGDPRHGVKAIAMVDDQVTAAERKLVSGQTPEVAGDSYLQIGELIGDLALVYDWCSISLTPAQRSRWITYANQAVANVWNHTGASWGGKPAPWTGWSVDDPGDNYYYSFLRATMLLGLATQGENPQAAAWIAKFRERLIGRLVPYMTAEQPDGGSREGTGYGVALRNLFELYALWQWSTGENLADMTPHTRASLLTMASQIMPTLDRKAPIGDQSRDSTAALFDYERACLLELISLYPTSADAAGVAALLALSSVTSMANGFMVAYDVIYAPPTTGVNVLDLPLVRHAKGIGEINARSSWSKDATWLGLICGPFTQSHAHEDQGSLMIYKGSWLAHDAVIHSKGGVRESGSIVGTTAAHSLVRLSRGGTTIPQHQGTTSKVLALRVGPGYLFAALDLTAAYDGAAGVTAVRRQVLWLQPDAFVVHDRVVTAIDVQQTWQLVTPVVPVINNPSAVIGAGGHALRVTRIAPAAASWTVTGLTGGDMAGGWRLDQVVPGGDRTYVTALSIDSATVPTVMWNGDVGCTFLLGGRQITLDAGFDPL